MEEADWQDYGRYYDEFDADDETEAFYFSAAAGRARIVIGNRRWGEHGYVSSGRMQARPAPRPRLHAKVGCNKQLGSVHVLQSFLETQRFTYREARRRLGPAHQRQPAASRPAALLLLQARPAPRPGLLPNCAPRSPRAPPPPLVAGGQCARGDFSVVRDIRWKNYCSCSNCDALLQLGG